eukprot:PhM_4_TR7655/c0_g1_i1/m.29891
MKHLHKTLMWATMVLAILTIIAHGNEAEGGDALQDTPSTMFPAGTVSALRSDTYSAALQDAPFWVVLFHVPWCPHCKQLRPIFNEVANNTFVMERAANLRLGQVNCEDQHELCALLNVRSYPTVKYAVHGQVYTYHGGRTYERLVQFAYVLSIGHALDYMDIVGNLDLYCKQVPLQQRFIFIHRTNNTALASYSVIRSAVARSIHFDGLSFSQIVSPSLFRKYATADEAAGAPVVPSDDTDPSASDDVNTIIVMCSDRPGITRVNTTGVAPPPLVEGNDKALARYFRENRFLAVETLTQYTYSSAIRQKKWMCFVIGFGSEASARAFEILRASVGHDGPTEGRSCILMHVEGTVLQPWLQQYKISPPESAQSGSLRYLIVDPETELYWTSPVVDKMLEEWDLSTPLKFHSTLSLTSFTPSTYPGYYFLLKAHIGFYGMLTLAFVLAVMVFGALAVLRSYHEQDEARRRAQLARDQVLADQRWEALRLQEEKAASEQAESKKIR